MKHVDDMLLQKGHDFKNLIIMDRGYPSFEVIKHIENANIKYLARTKSNFFKEVSQTNSNDEWVTIKITPSRKKHLKQQNYIANTGDSVIVRVVKFILSNGDEETLITNLSNEEATYDDCTQLYFKRWGIETRYDELKSKFEIENFSGKV
jgi:IS4 transposase